MAIFLRNFPDVDGKTLMTRTAIKYKQRLEAAILITVETRAEANRSVDRGIGQNEKLKKKNGRTVLTKGRATSPMSA